MGKVLSIILAVVAALCAIFSIGAAVGTVGFMFLGMELEATAVGGEAAIIGGEVGAVSGEVGVGAVEAGAGAVEVGAGAGEVGAGAVEVGAGAGEVGAGAVEVGAGAAEAGAGAAEVAAESLSSNPGVWGWASMAPADVAGQSALPWKEALETAIDTMELGWGEFDENVLLTFSKKAFFTLKRAGFSPAHILQAHAQLETLVNGGTAAQITKLGSSAEMTLIDGLDRPSLGLNGFAWLKYTLDPHFVGRVATRDVATSSRLNETLAYRKPIVKRKIIKAPWIVVPDVIVRPTYDCHKKKQRKHDPKCDITGYEGETLKVISYNTQAGTAKACWKSHPDVCGELHGFYPPCTAIDTDTFETITITGEGLGWNYNHPIGNADIPHPTDPRRGTKKQWVLLTNFDLDYDCKKLWWHAIGGLPQCVNGVCKAVMSLSGKAQAAVEEEMKSHPAVIKPQPGETLPEPVGKWPWDDPKSYKQHARSVHMNSKRHTNAKAELVDYFTKIPLDRDDSKKHARNGAALVHSHLSNSNDTVINGDLMVSAMTRILETHDQQYKMAQRRWFRRSSESNGDIMTNALIDAMLEGVSEQDYERHHTHALQAVGRATFDRAKRGEAGPVDAWALHKMFQRSFGHDETD